MSVDKLLEENMIKLSFQNGNFNLSATYVDIAEALGHHKTTYSTYDFRGLILTFEASLEEFKML
jgi:hypothetical protein